MSTNQQNNQENSPSEHETNDVVTTSELQSNDHDRTSQEIPEIDAEEADQSDSWETDDEGDFYTEPSNGRFLDPDDESDLLGSGLSRHLIECYPMTTAEEISVVGIVCDICLNEYKANDKVRTIPCLHRFHTRCIDKWLMKSTKCPMCRSDLRKSKWYSA